jgi:glutamate synthase domain-containing protein 2
VVPRSLGIDATAPRQRMQLCGIWSNHWESGWLNERIAQKIWILTYWTGLCWALLLMLVALYADRYTAIGQQTSDQSAAGDNELQVSLTVITEQLTQVMKSLSELQQENAKMSQYIMEIRRHQVESDAASDARFELLKRADGKNETLASFEQLNQGHIQLKTGLEAALTDVKQQLLQQLNATTGTLIIFLYLKWSSKLMTFIWTSRDVVLNSVD